MTLTRFSLMDGQVLVRPVVPRVSSVSTRHAFVLDADNKLFLFAGRDSAPAEQSAAEEYVALVLAESDTRAMSVLRVTDERRSALFFELLGGDAALVSRECVQVRFLSFLSTPSSLTLLTPQVVPPPHLSVFQDALAYPRPTLFSFASLPEHGCALVDARFEFVLAGAEPALFKMLFQDWPSLGKEPAAPVVAAVVAPAPSSAGKGTAAAAPAATPAPTPAARKKTIFSTIGRTHHKSKAKAQDK
jgi:hypothetical protein